jgi:thiol:disulfide interchange protein DsbD
MSRYALPLRRACGGSRARFPHGQAKPGPRSAAGATGIKRAKPFQRQYTIQTVSEKLRQFVFLATLAIPLAITTLSATPHVTAEIIPAYTQVTPGSSVSLNVRLDIAPGWHIYGENPGDAGVPTRIAWQYDAAKFHFSDISWPVPSRFETAGLESFGYKDRVVFPFSVTLLASAMRGDRLDFVADIRWIACRELCIPESARVTGSVLVGDALIVNPLFADTIGLSDAAAVSLSGGWGLIVLMLGAAFLGGLLLNVMPCVFPVLSLKLFQFLPKVDTSSLGNAVEFPSGTVDVPALRRDIFAYASGVLVSFWVMTAVLLVVRQFLGVVGWGIQLQYPGVVFGLMLLFLVLALNFFGLFEIGLSFQRLGQGPKTHAAREFWSGVLIVLVATPCTAPFLGAAIGFALGQSAWVAAVVLTAMGLGLASPMVFLAFFPSVLKRMPKPGAWMLRVRQFLGFPMLGSVIWLFWVLLQQWGEMALLPVLVLLLCLAFGLWCVGLCQHSGRFRLGSGILIVLLAVSVFGYLSLSPSRSQTSVVAASDFAPFSDEALAAALDSGRPVFVDVTASWCLTCQVNKKVVLETDAAKALFEKSKVILLRADWTTQDQRITEYLSSFQRSGVPMYVYYAPGKPGQVLPEVLRMSVLEAAIRGE